VTFGLQRANMPG